MQPGQVLQPAPQPDRLLEGEDPRTVSPQDARHWIAVYDEMIEFKERLLDRVRSRLTALPVAARQDVIGNDIVLIEAQLLRYRGRLEYWNGRQWALEITARPAPGSGRLMRILVQPSRQNPGGDGYAHPDAG